MPPASHVYQHLLEAMPVMLWTANKDGVWEHVNGAWIAYTGVIGQTRGFGFEAAVHPADEARTVAVWKRAVEQGQDYQIEYRLRSQTGHYRWFLTRGVRVTDDLGLQLAWVGTCTDIDDRKRAEQQAVDAREAAVRALGLVLEARDRETKGHTDRVMALALELGQALGLSGAQLETLRLGSYLHDIGKMVIPDAILLKTGPLTEQEWAVMRSHTLEGERFAAALGFVPPEVLELIRFHHERWDGGGYVSGLSGEAIPLLARVFAVVDVYDALLSERPYKVAWTQAQAADYLQAEAGRQLDPHIVATFLHALQGGPATAG
nr:HD domain-containing phosphohydrolase [Deinococcus betulae]